MESNSLSWQSVETRGCALIKTAYGMVSVIPVGMGQVSSVNFIETIKPGTKVNKGDELGYFLFGGSDCVMLFEGKSGYSAGYRHFFCREEYGSFLGEPVQPQ